MTSFTSTCRECAQPFVIDEQDQKYYQKIGVPFPKLCPEDRQRRRLAYRNERNLYYRKCDLCTRQIISIYHAESPYTVYCNSCWWSDAWDAQSYGQNIDFSRPFFEQFRELQLKVPRLALYQKNSENSEYTNHAENNRNCYLCIDTAHCENVYYSKWLIRCRDCLDCYNIEESELCYETQYQARGYQNLFNFFSDYTTYSAFTYACVNCQNCFMCSNLNRKQYCIRNQQVSQEEYEAFMANLNLGSYEILKALKEEYADMIKNAPKRAGLLILCENSEGDCMYQCKNVKDSFDVINSEDSRYCYDAGHLKDCYDVYESAFDCELQYNCHGCNRGKFLKMGHVSYDMSDSAYIDSCYNSRFLFGCVGLRRKEYCIFNKSYSKEEYEHLVSQLIEHMQKTGEWGEFFPMQLSPFAYNETVAQEFFPLSREEALTYGYSWKEDSETNAYQGPIYELPEELKDTPESVTQAILQCEESGKLYKIIPQEFALHQKLGVALPRRSTQQRYLDRLKLRNPRRLWPWNCTACQTEIRAPYEPSSQKEVYCQRCFTQKFYA